MQLRAGIARRHARRWTNAWRAPSDPHPQPAQTPALQRRLPAQSRRNRPPRPAWRTNPPASARRARPTEQFHRHRPTQTPCQRSLRENLHQNCPPRLVRSMLNPQTKACQEWSHAFKRRVLLTPSVRNCQGIQRSDRVVSRKRGRLSSSVWNGCSPKRLGEPRRQGRFPIQPGRSRLTPPHQPKLPPSAFRLNNPAKPG